MILWCWSTGLDVVEELHVNVGGEVLGLSHESLEVLASPVLGGSDIASLVVILLCHNHKERMQEETRRSAYKNRDGKGTGQEMNLRSTLTKDNDSVGVVTAATREVAKAVGLLVRVGMLGNLLEHVDDLVSFGGTLGLNADSFPDSARRLLHTRNLPLFDTSLSFLAVCVLAAAKQLRRDSTVSCQVGSVDYPTCLDFGSTASVTHKCEWRRLLLLVGYHNSSSTEVRAYCVALHVS